VYLVEVSCVVEDDGQEAVGASCHAVEGAAHRHHPRQGLGATEGGEKQAGGGEENVTGAAQPLS